MEYLISSPETIESENEQNIDIDIKRAKEVVNNLLKADIKYYQKLIPVINKLKPYEFNELFKGNIESNYLIKKIDIKRLCYKFNQFHKILYEWYEDETKYKYLEELWKNYPNLKNLESKEKEEIKNILSLEIEDFSNWEENIKDSLCNLIKSPNINNEFNNECFKQDSSEIYGLIDKIKKIKDKLKENEKEKMKIIFWK